MKRQQWFGLGVVAGMVFALSSVGAAEAKEDVAVADDAVEAEEVVVTATRTATALREVGSSVSVVDARQIERRQHVTVEEAVQETPGIVVLHSGGRGQAASIFMRGMKSENTLVLIDGVEMNDPSLIARNADLRHINTDSVNRIEVLRGPQSTLYGSDSMGGVVNILTKKGKPGKPEFEASLEGGSYDTVSGRVSASGGSEKVQFAAGVSRSHTNGFSAANENRIGNEEDDGYDNLTLFGRLTFTPCDIFDLDIIARHTEADYDFDNGAGNDNDDENRIGEDRQTMFRTQAGLNLFDGRWEQRFGVSLNTIKRESIDPDTASGTWPNEIYWGKTEKFDWQNDIHLHRTNTLTLGMETEKEIYEHDNDGDSPYNVRTNSFYAQDQIKLFDSWFTTLGIRRDRHDEFGGKTTWRATTAYLLRKTGTKFHASYGTGFKAPSLYQLYAPPSWGANVGNEDLQPEESKGWDVGFEQRLWQGRFSFGATYFRNNMENMIDYVWNPGGDPDGYYNRNGDSYTKGMESFLAVKPMKNLTFRLDYTYTKTWDEEDELEFARRPQNVFFGSVNYSFHEGRGNVNTGVRYMGSRYDDAANDDRMPAFTVVDVAASYDITENWNIFGRIDNLFDREYEEVEGYGTPGRSAYLGVKVTF